MKMYAVIPIKRKKSQGIMQAKVYMYIYPF